MEPNRPISQPARLLGTKYDFCFQRPFLSPLMDCDAGEAVGSFRGLEPQCWGVAVLGHAFAVMHTIIGAMVG